MQIIKHIHCPVNGWDCPYYTDKNHPCRCTLENPMEECDDFANMWDEGDDYIDNDWVVGGYADQLIEGLKQKGCQMGYPNSKWFALSEIEKIAKEIEIKLLTNK